MYEFMGRWLKVTTTLILISPLSAVSFASDLVDGFFAYCTGNNDSTGICKNEETGRSYICQIIPAGLIDCTSSSSKSFQCIWISSPVANSAEFWCDKKVDQMLREEFTSNIIDNEFRPGNKKHSQSATKDRSSDNLDVTTPKPASADKESFSNLSAPQGESDSDSAPSREPIDNAEIQIQIRRIERLNPDRNNSY